MRHLLLLLAYFSLNHLLAQLCGTPYSPRPENDWKAIQKFKGSQKSNEVDSVAITFFIVEAIKGDSRVPTALLLDEVESATRIFFQANIRFFMCGSPRIIQGENNYSFGSGAGLNAGLYVPNTINVYLVNEVTTNDGTGLCGFANFPWVGRPQDRFVFMAKDCLGGGKVLAHELGHFFGLYHTHETFSGREFVNGSNCSTAGDLICDTPADPNLGTGNVQNCIYVGGQKDPLGDLYAPNTGNVMSYAPTSCIRFFSPEQHELVQYYSLNNNDYLRSQCNEFPDLGLNIDLKKKTIRSGESFSVAVNFSSLGFKQGDEAKVYVYLSQDQNDLGQIIQRENIRIPASSGKFALDLPVSFPITKGSGTYYVQIVIDPEFEVVELTEANNNVQFELIVDNSAFDDALVFPNPVSSTLRLFIRDKLDKGDMSILFSDVTGRIIWTTSSFKNGDEFLNEFDISHLPNGILFMSVEFDRRKSKYNFTILKD